MVTITFGLFVCFSSLQFFEQLRERGVVCREASNECDIPEHCTGDSGECPRDVYKKNGNQCGELKSAMGEIIGKLLNTKYI